MLTWHVLKISLKIKIEMTYILIILSSVFNYSTLIKLFILITLILIESKSK